MISAVRTLAAETDQSQCQWRARAALVCATAVLALLAGPSIASAASPTYNMLGSWTVSGTGGGAATGSYDITQMDMSTGAFSGTAVISGTGFSVSGTESGSTATYDLTESSYTAHDTLPLSVLPDGHVGGDGSFTDTNGNSGTFHAEQDAVSHPTLASTGTVVVCNSGPNPGDDSTCTATVADTSQAATTPTGTVGFVSNNAGRLTSAQCDLTPDSGAAASCTVTYVPDANDDFPDVTASYGGDNKHASSAGTAALMTAGPELGLPAGTPLDTTSCEQGNPADGQTAASFRPNYNRTHPNPVSSDQPVSLTGAIGYCASNLAYNVAGGLGVVVKYPGALAAGTATLLGGAAAGLGQVEAGSPVTGYATAMASGPVAGGVMYGTYQLGDAIMNSAATAQNDPPDRHYKLVAKPGRVPNWHVLPGPGVSKTLARQLGTLLRLQEEADGLANAFSTSVDRAGGARQAKANKWVGVQTRAAIRDARQLASLLPRVATASSAVASALAHRPGLLRAPSKSQLRKLRKLTAHGLPKAVGRTLTMLGYTRAQQRRILADIRSAHSAAPSKALLNPALPAALRLAAKAMQYYPYVSSVSTAAKL